jgi:hypothetical protein
METPAAIDNILTDFVPYFGFGFFLVSSYLPPQVSPVQLLRHCGSRISAMSGQVLRAKGDVYTRPQLRTEFHRLRVAESIPRNAAK